ncbi:hypothetical protein Cme02nite_05420 [Catellatospora methionotrophica]|uniref:Uncharacterized protein n=2 Tax=Catellatospora methionotrophica TaxID=121620 RepID=A0A8J3LGH8_9ACTN|nr:hypothetical protein Cme02nite_05420 [Catellatospora methionotrophica]
MGVNSGPGTVAERLSRLFDTVTSPHTGKRFTDREVGAAVGCSHTLIFDLRKGNTPPEKTQAGILMRLARHFGMDDNHLMPAGSSPVDPEVWSFAMRAKTISPQGLAMLNGVLDHIAELEARAATRPEAAGNASI